MQSDTGQPNKSPIDTVLSRLEAVKDKGSRWEALCPAHSDRNPSLSVREGDDHRVLLKCFAGCTAEQIVQEIGLTMKNLFVRDEEVKLKTSKKIAEPELPEPPLTIERLANAKGFTAEYLANLGVGPNPNGNGLLIAYLREDYSACPRQRIRLRLYGKKKSIWDNQKGEIEAYGQWLLPKARQTKYLFLVEGETDCWTLWQHRFPALGIPGASMVKTLKGEHLAGFTKVYVVQESDKGGEKFIAGITKRIAEIGWGGDLRVIQMPL